METGDYRPTEHDIIVFKITVTNNDPDGINVIVSEIIDNLGSGYVLYDPTL